MVEALIDKLQNLNIRIEILEHDKLKIHADISKIPEDILWELKQNKESLVSFLREQQANDTFEKIPPAKPSTSYPLSSAQRRLWILSQFEEANIGYNIPAVYEFEGELERGALEYAFASLVGRHESLRTVFREEDGEPRQFMLDSANTGFSIRYLDLRDDSNQSLRVNDLVREEFEKAFDLSAGPLLRAGLFRVAANKWVFTYVMHHIISDGWSMNILIDELLLFYNAYINGTTELPAPLHIHYKDYSVWQREQLRGQTLEQHVSYWLGQFEGELPVLELPDSKPRPPVKTYHGSEISRRIPAALAKDLKAFNQQRGATLFMGLLAAVNALLYRYTRQEDIVIGTPVAGREHADLENQIGFYANTLALRTRFTGDYSYLQLLDEVKSVTLGAYDHQVYPFDELVDKLNLHRDISRNPLFDIQVILNNLETDSKNENGGSAKLAVNAYGGAKSQTIVFDMVFNFLEIGEELFLNILYNTDIYKESMVRQLAGHLEQLLSALVAFPGTPVRQLQYLTKAEQHQLLHEFNNTVIHHEGEKTLTGIFEEQVKLTPDETAVVFGSAKLSYLELDKKATRLAACLRNQYHVSSNQLVGIMLDRSDNLVVSMLGIMKAGAAYVPIDPAYPQARKEFMIKDAGIKILITQADYILDLAYYSGSIFAIDVQLDLVSEIVAEDPVAKVAAGDLAYVIYTSGSTGAPKGVMIEHGAIVNTVYAQKNVFGLPAGTRGLQFSSPSFDSSVWEIFMSLGSGGSLYIIEEDAKKNPGLLEAYIRDNQIEIAALPPAYHQMLQLENIPTFRRLITAGEAAIRDKALSFSAHGSFYNGYGPTETSICATLFCIAPGQSVESAHVPAGKPIPNTRIYILDDNEALVPVNVTGEICISGAGLARGYLNNPELTAKKFVPNPFILGERLYKTGDLGKWLPDGNVMFTGRKDDQVKIRGYRIELGEIEAALNSHADIDAAAVLANTNSGGEKELVAYITGTPVLNIPDLRSFLASTLPAFMVPHHFVLLDEIPLTTSGKLDRKKLPVPSGLDGANDYAAPGNEIEQVLVEVYEEVLKKQPVGIYGNFFLLGGDSIKSIQIISRLKQRGYSLMIQDVLLHPVVQDLAKVVNVARRIPEQGPVSGIIPLSPIQHFLLDEDFADRHYYNQSVLLQFHGSFSEAGLQAALDKIVFHHDALRMVFIENGKGWRQENKPPVAKAHLEIIDDDGGHSFLEHCNRIKSGMHLQEGPLFKAALFRGTGRLLLVAHHLVIDGISWRILFEDLSSLYLQYISGKPLSLPLKTDSFSYWQQKQCQYARSEALEKEDVYWSAVESAPVKRLLPDNPGGSNRMKDVAEHSFFLGQALTGRLLTQCYKLYQAEINDMLLTAFSLAVHEIFGLKKILLNMEGHGRENIGEDVDISRTAGWFTSMYPVLIEVDDPENKVEQLLSVKQSLRSVPNKGIGYGILRYLTGKNYTLNPDFTFNYLGDFGSGESAANEERLFSFSADYHGSDVSGNLKRSSILDVSGMVVENCMQLSIAYSTQQYASARIKTLAVAYERHLMALIECLSTDDLNKPQDVKDYSRAQNADPLPALRELSYNQLLYFSDPRVSNNAILSQHEFENLDLEAFKAAVQLLLNRQDVLRTVFVNDNGRPMLKVLPSTNPGFQIGDPVAVDSEAELDLLISQESARTFDLYDSPLFHVMIIKLPGNRYRILFNIHHSITDGYSGGILYNELLNLYSAVLTKTESTLKPLPFQYNDFANWQKSLVDSPEGLAQRNYWLKKLAGFNPATGFLTSQAKGGQPGSISITGFIDELLYEEVNRFLQKNGLTRATLLMGILNMVLGQLSGSHDITIITAVSSRDSILYKSLDVKDLIGLFANQLLVRNPIKTDNTAIGFLKEVQYGFVEDLSFSAYPFAKLIQELPGNIKTADLLHSIVYYNFHNYSAQNESVYDINEERGKLSESGKVLFYPLGLSVMEYKNCLKLEFLYDRTLFTPVYAASITESYFANLKLVLTDPYLSVSQINSLLQEQFLETLPEKAD